MTRRRAGDGGGKAVGGLGPSPFDLSAEFGVVVDEPPAHSGSAGDLGDLEGFAGDDHGVQSGQEPGGLER